MSDKAQTIAKHLKDCRVIRIAQARCGLDQRIEYFLHVERRPADDLQNIGGGGLLFPGFPYLSRARPPLLRQPRVLSWGCCFVGVGVWQIDLSVSKGANLGASEGDCADGITRAN